MVESIKKQKGFSLIEILLVTVILALLYYTVTKIFLRGPIVDKKTQQSLAEQGIDFTNYPGMINTTRDKVNDINKEIKDRRDQLQGME